MSLAEFIRSHHEETLREFAAFAKTLMPPGTEMTESELRDHAEEILTAVVDDMHLKQTLEEQHRKSQGHGTARSMKTSSRRHAADRLVHGYTFQAVLAEFRALRASVLRLYEESGATDLRDVRRFNEAIDEALTESMREFAHETDLLREREAFLLKLSDALRPLDHPSQSKLVATRLLGEHLHIDHVFYADAEDGQWVVSKGYGTDLDPLPDRPFSLSTYGNWIIEGFKAGTPLVVSDMHADGRFLESERQARLALRIGAEVAVPLVKNGELAAILVARGRSPRAWSAQDIAMINEAAERTWAAAERARAETALAASEDKYRTLFESIDEGVGTVELVFDAEGHVADYIYLEQNPAFERLTGLSSDAIGKRISEVVPDLEPFWFETFERVAKTGDAERFEHAVSALGRWFDVYVSRVGGTDSRRIVYVYNDITERIRREANVALLAEVSHALAGVATIDETMQIIGASIAAHFGLSACAFAELPEDAQVGVINHAWHRADVPSLLGTYRIADFVTPEILRLCQAGEAAVIRDVFADSRTDGDRYAALKIRSFVIMPLLRDGEWRFLLVLHRSEPYEWRDDEIELLRELTTRIWTRLEGTRAEAALRQSEQRLQRMVNVPSVGVLTFGRTGTLVGANDAFLEMVGYTRDEFSARTFVWQDFTPPEFMEESSRQFERLLQTGLAGPYEKEYLRQDATRIWLMFVASALGDGTFVEYAVDITARKRAETAARISEARLAAAFNALPSGVGIIDLEGRFILSNRELQRYLPSGVVPSRDSARPLLWRAWHQDGSIVEPNDFPSARALRGETVVPGLEMLCRQSDGTELWTQVATVPVREANGEIIGVATVITDIDTLKRGEAVLRDSEEKLRQLNEQLEHRVRDRTAQIRALLLRLMTAQEEERRRIARDIHDQLGQQMTALRTNIEIWRSRSGEDSALLEQAERTQRLAEELDQSVDFLTWQLRPAALDHLGLSAALQNLTTGWSERFGTPAEFAVDGVEDMRLPRNVEANLYRIAQEALHNVAKHAEATQVTMLLTQRGGQLALVIEDDGRGFHPPASSAADGSMGMGLVNMRERAVLVGGELEIDSSPDHGTSIYVRIPEANAAHGRQ